MERRLVGGWWEVEGRIARAITVEAMMVKVKMTAVGGRVGRRWSVGRWGGKLRSEVWWAAPKARGASPYRPNQTPLPGHRRGYLRG